MAYESKSTDVGTSATTVYTATGNVLVTGVLISNVHASNSSTFKVTWIDTSNSNKETILLSNATLNAGSNVNSIPEGFKLFLSAGDSIRVTAGTASSLAATVSIAEV